VIGRSTALYDALAADYEHHFDIPHRRAYDDLAWERVRASLPPPPAHVVDAGAGIGRWAVRLLDLGYTVTGIEPAPEMARRAEKLTARTKFRLLHQSIETTELPVGSVDAVLAMGSLQYTPNPVEAIARMAAWLRPGGLLSVLVDSRQALVLELLRTGRTDEALDRAATGIGVWHQGDLEAELYLLDAAHLSAAYEQAGVDVEDVCGLLVGASILAPGALRIELERDFEARLAVERMLAGEPGLADLGKQLFVSGRRRNSL
jgi:SAM-dependent methyltransferase